MIEAKDILYSVRALLKDNNEMTYSDYDIKLALNTALRYISQSSLLKTTDFLETTKLITNSDIENGANLPEDFQSLTGVTSGEFSLAPCRVTKKPKVHEYKIMGEKIYSGAESFTINYKRLVLPISDLTKDTISLPMFCTNLIIESTIAVLKGTPTADLITQMNNIITADLPVQKYNGKTNQA